MGDDSTGVVVAIVGTAAVLVIVFCIVGVWWYMKKRRRHLRRNQQQTTTMKLDEAFHNVAFSNTENPPPYNAPANQQQGNRPPGQVPLPAIRQSPTLATPTGVVSANPSGYSYKASKPQYGGPTPTAAAAQSGPALQSLAAPPQPGKGRQQGQGQGGSSKDSGLASTSIHSNGNSIDDEEVAPYSMFAAGLLTDATSTSARAIVEGAASSPRDAASPRQVALNANGPASKNSLTTTADKTGYSPPVGKRPPGMSPPQNFIKMEKVKGAQGQVAPPIIMGGPVPVYAVPTKRPYVNTRPDPYAAAKQATAQRLNERAKRVRQLNSDADTSASPDIDGGASGSMQQSFDGASSSDADLSKASNFDFDDGEPRPSKKVRFQTPEEPEKPRKRQLSARYRIRGAPGVAHAAAVPAFVDVPRLGRFMINPQAPGGGGVPLVRSNSNERRRGSKPPTGRAPAGAGAAAGVALNTSTDHVTMRQSSTSSLPRDSSSSLNMSTSVANISMQQQQQEVKQPPGSDVQPAKSILRRQGSNGSLNSSRDARRRRTASDDVSNVGATNGGSHTTRPASMDIEASFVDAGPAAVAAYKRVASEPEVHVVTEATRGRKPSSKHLSARPASMEIPSPSSPSLQKPSVESDV